MYSAILQSSENHTALPFTVSHAAAFLPFRKLNLVWSAFIVGTLAPDFPYVIGNTRYRDLGHHFPGVVLFTLPAGLVVLWLFHNVVKQPFLELLPAGMQARLRAHAGEFRFGGRRRFVAVFGSLLLGIATHLVWDSFTHSFTWPWRHIRWLRQRVNIPLVGSVPSYAALQYASSIVGMLALAVWIWSWYRNSQPDNYAANVTSRFPAAVTMFAVAGLAGLCRAALVVGVPVNRGTADLFMLTFGVTALALAFWELVLYCVVVSSRRVSVID
jgi:Domain of unknown function (DUF4184)